MKLMTTPIYDFVQNYINKDGARLHMPGHKGQKFLGCEDADLTEIFGADELYDARGIIAESQKNASELFGSGKTLYSTEGSSQCIRAMLYLATLSCKNRSEKPVILAGRNAHKVFVLTAALLDFDIEWLRPEEEDFTLCRCDFSAENLRKRIRELKGRNLVAVYVTSPDYLGGVADIGALADTAHVFGLPLIVDDAHGAYRKFLGGGERLHPMDLGADMCCDSAHKTLPVLTGGAYLHIAKNADDLFFDEAERAMSLFGSTSPSYLILQSLDICNRYLSDGYEKRLADCVEKVESLKKGLHGLSVAVSDSDPLKLCILSKEIGYEGRELAGLMAEKGLVCEYCDPDNIVLMFTPENKDRDYSSVLEFFGTLEIREKINRPFLSLQEPERVLSPAEALKLPSEMVNRRDSVGRILSSPTVGCPPAVPVVVSGERISDQAAKIFKYYGIEQLRVVPEDI